MGWAGFLGGSCSERIGGAGSLLAGWGNQLLLGLYSRADWAEPVWKQGL